MQKERTIIIISEEGNAKLHEEKELPLLEAVKETAKKALELWKLQRSDFIIIKDKYPVEIKLPITSEEYETYSKYNLQRTSPKTASFELPVYIISFDNEWLEKEYIDHKVFIVTISLNKELNKQIIEWSKDITSTEE